MLRFPFHKNLTILTTHGIITGKIIQANKSFVILQEVAHRGNPIDGNFFLDRKYIMGFSIIDNSTINSAETIKDKKKLGSPKILQFNPQAASV